MRALFQCHDFPPCPFPPATGDCPSRPGPAWRCPEGGKICPFFSCASQHNCLFLCKYCHDGPRQKQWTFPPCISPVYKAITPQAPCNSLKNLFLMSPSSSPPGPLLEEYVCFYFVLYVRLSVSQSADCGEIVELLFLDTQKCKLCGRGKSDTICPR